MRQIFTAIAGCLFMVQAASAQDFPALSGRVVDAAGVIPSNVEATLTGLLQSHEETTDNQVVVVTIPDLQGYDIADFGYQLGRHWGIGQKGKDNGLLFIIAPNERKLRIEVGYGLEGDMPDATAKSIIDTVVVPAFKSGDMAGGIQAGTRSILDVLKNGTWTPPEKKKEADVNVTNALIMIVLFVIFTIVGLLRRDRSTRSSRLRRGRHRHGWVPMTGGGVGGGFSGGGFSGGGGSFGGGGASGGW